MLSGMHGLQVRRWMWSRRRLAERSSGRSRRYRNQEQNKI